ncbi:response regulator transcription factor [Cupriavidus respiraculi]|uniref:response regulator n=1 Tax=Cupriavidus respiraculi TaxID=195930 RepID=UPI001C94A0C9|nr:response regulator transcription factor [Cupriavidus respiraculi]MBY4947167.1 response regulator transcription factor [Cupriavidus respiraculi]
MIRVLICDDHRIVREGLRQILADADDIGVVAEAADGPEAVRLLREANPCPADVLLLDIAMPGRDGLDVLRQLKSEMPRLPALMLSTYPDKQYAVRSIRLGAAGYLNKSADTEELVAAIRKAAAGKVYVTPAIAEALAAAISEMAGRQAHETLSNREYQVFRLIAAGNTVGQIAQALALSPNTVSTYRARILEKTGVRNDVELALYAVRQNLLEA